jgi:hypothetical protein
MMVQPVGIVTTQSHDTPGLQRTPPSLSSLESSISGNIACAAITGAGTATMVGLLGYTLREALHAEGQSLSLFIYSGIETAGILLGSGITSSIVFDVIQMRNDRNQARDTEIQLSNQQNVLNQV